MTDAEIMKGVKLCNGDLGNCKECPFDSIGKTCGIELAKAEIGLIERLQAENAELKSRLEKAVELPCKIGDTVYKVHDKCDGHNCPYNGYYGQWRCHYEGKQRCEPFISTEQFCYNHIPLINKTVFIPKEAAEARLAEREGKEE